MTLEAKPFGTIRFDETDAFHRLKELAQNPPDLTDPSILTAKRIKEYRVEGAGLEVLYGTERVNDEIMSALESLANETEVLSQFRSLMAGEIMNRIEGYPSEERQVTHFACRDVFGKLRTPFNTLMAEPAKKAARDQLKNLELFLEALDEGGLGNDRGETFTDLIHVGIGGSELGPKAMAVALSASARPDRKLHFVSNIDPDGLAAIVPKVDLARTLVNVVSKSGSTMETRTNELALRSIYQKPG